MKVKVSELSGPALDWAVAKCEGYLVDENSWMLNATVKDVDEGHYKPSQYWGQGGPIIHQKQITTLPPVVRRISKARHAFPVDYWRAMIQKDEDELAIHSAGPTPLIAAMRCYVASNLGEEVEIPEELV